MDAAQLAQVEALCETLYNSTDEAARSHAQNQLLSLQTSAERIPQCQYILDHSENAYALLLASSSLTRLISNHWNNFTSPQRVEIRNYILNYLGSVGPGLTDYVRTSLIQLLCRITKLGWFDDQRHREVVDAVMRFLQVCACARAGGGGGGGGVVRGRFRVCCLVYMYMICTRSVCPYICTYMTSLARTCGVVRAGEVRGMVGSMFAAAAQGKLVF